MINNNPFQKKKQKSYFEQQIEKRGENFWDTMTLQQKDREIRKRIFKDMVYGNINYAEHGKYIMPILDQAITAARSLKNENWTIADALAFAEVNPYYQNKSPMMSQLKTFHNELYRCYAIIEDTLCQCKWCGNIGPLSQIAVMLRPYQNAIGQT